MNVLVAYASKYGSTREIATAIGDTLRAQFPEVEVKPADSVTNLDAYDVIILGSALYYGDWMDAATKFMRDFADPLSQKPVWLFSSGPTDDGRPTETMNRGGKGWTFPHKLTSLEARIKPEGARLFTGKIDASRLNMQDWLAHRSMRGVTGDYRNWETVEAWAKEVAETLKKRANETSTA